MVISLKETEKSKDDFDLGFALGFFFGLGAIVIFMISFKFGVGVGILSIVELSFVFFTYFSCLNDCIYVPEEKEVYEPGYWPDLEIAFSLTFSFFAGLFSGLFSNSVYGVNSGLLVGLGVFIGLALIFFFGSKLIWLVNKPKSPNQSS